MWGTEAYVVYMQSLLLSEKGNNIFKWAPNSTYYWRSSRVSKQPQTSQCFLLTQRATPSGGAVSPQRSSGTHYLHRLPTLSWTCIKVAFVWQRAGHAYPYYTVASCFPAEACKYQKGIICCGCRHTPGRHTPVSDFGEQDVSLHITWAPIIYTGVQSNDYPGTESIWKAYGTIFNTLPAKSKDSETWNRWVCLRYWCYFKWPAGGCEGSWWGDGSRGLG